MADRILIVDDDAALVKMLSGYFELKGYQLITALNGEEAMKKISQKPDIIILDINMPKMDGLEVCKRIRNQISCPILFLTAKVEEEDRVNGLLLGGDDYVLKPFSLKELEARIIAHLKREERRSTKTKLRLSEKLGIDYLERKLTYDGKEIELTKMEYDIVEFLSMHPGQVFDKERIYEKVCRYDAESDSRVITELIRRIRNKIIFYTETEFILTVWGSGYKWKK